MEKIKSKQVKRGLVVRKETVRALSDESLQAVAGGRMPHTTDTSVAHCSNGAGCGTTTISVTS